jgi:hypothetical protein
VPHTRRAFIHASFNLTALVALRRVAGAREPSPSGAAMNRGLLFAAADLPRIRATLARPEFADWWRATQQADLEADRRFLRDELQLNNLIVHQLRAQLILLRCAFVHAVAPDPRQLALARFALRRLLDYRRLDWILEGGRHTVGVMRGAGACVALVLAADWLADEMSADEHAEITHRLGDEGGPACHRAVFGMTHHDKVAGWTMDRTNAGLTFVDVSRWPEILDRTNLRIIATSGLAAAAVHLHGRHPDAGAWLDLARDSLRRYAGRLPADGSFDEGISYWNFTFGNYILSVEIIRRALGLDDRRLADFPAMTRYAMTMAMPTAGNPADCINVGDASVSSDAVPLAWIAREFRDPTAQYLATRPAAIRPTGNTALAAIWFDPTVPATPPAGIPLDRLCAPGIVVSRSGWQLADGVVAFRSGDPANHEHADRNSVLFKAHGERLLHDPLHANYSPQHPKWLLRLTEAHTAVLIAGRGHTYHHGEEGTNSSTATATLQAHRFAADWMTATSDATDAYRRAGLPVLLVQRTLVYLKPDTLIIADRVQLSEPQPVQARFQVFNDDQAGRVSADDHGFIITRPTATLHARVHAAGARQIAAGQLALPPGEGIYPYAEIISLPAREHTLLTVCTAAPSDAPHGAIAVTRDGDRWTLRGEHRGQQIAVTLAFSGDKVPQVSL